MKPEGTEKNIESAIESWGHEAFFKGADLDEQGIQEGAAWLYFFGNEKLKEMVLCDSPLQCQRYINAPGRGLSHTVQFDAWNSIEAKVWDLAWNDLWCEVFPLFRTSDRLSLFIALGLLVAKQTRKAFSQECGRYHEFSPDNLCHRFARAGFYDYLAARSLYMIRDRDLRRYIRFLRAGCFLSIFLKDVALICRRPEHIHLNSRGQLHCDGGPAVKWRDGWRSYYLNDVAVSEEIATTPGESLDPGLILRERNAGVRREIVRKVGIERVLKRLRGRVIDFWNGYELIALDIPGMSLKPVYLRMRNPSSGACHVEGVPPKISTCKAALSWRVGGLNWNPGQVT